MLSVSCKISEHILSELSSKSWFEKWFDTPYYPLLYGNRNDHEAEAFVNSLAEEVKRLLSSEKLSVLDLACGAGRHSRVFHKLGFKTTGIDLSVRSIETAKRESDTSIDFQIADMRTFDLPQEFDVVVNLFTSFGYFDSESDNLKVLDRVLHHLKPGGIFVIDFLNATKVIKGLVASESLSKGGIEFKIKRTYTGTHFVKNISFIDQGHDHSYNEYVQALTFDRIRAMLEESGFLFLDVRGDYSLANFAESSSERVIIFARKP